jgi:ubiquinone/menaquinone biosynthesis C-methylase UbiE
LVDYEMEEHWSAVGRQVRDRNVGNLFAGDDSPYNEYKAAQFGERFNPKFRVEGLAVLDVGCGPGGKLRSMTAQGARRVVGCDQSSEMVELAQQNAPGAEVFQIDGEHLPFSDHEFDLVTTTTVLQHNPDDRRTQLLGEICRVSANDVFLFEDTAVEMPPFTSGKGAYHNFYGRPIGWYAGVCSCHCFVPIEFDRQETFVSRTVHMRLWGHLNRGARREGEEFSKLHLAIEKRTLPFTKYLDRFIKNPKGELTMMHFRRAVADEPSGRQGTT